MNTSRGQQGGGVTVQRSLSSQQWTNGGLPPLLLVTMYVAFRWLTVHLRIYAGESAGLRGLYWALWCIAVPLAVLATRRGFRLFRSLGKRWPSR